MEITALCVNLPDDSTESDIENGLTSLIEKAKAEHSGLYSIRPPLIPALPSCEIIERGYYRVRYSRMYDIERAEVRACLDLLLIDLDKEVASGTVVLV
jgi:hypothetical protein